MTNKIELIKSLCEDWRKKALDEEGIIKIGESEEFRLVRNGINMHELSFEELQVCCIELTKILLLTGRNTIISEDHQLFWAWIGEVVNDINYFDSSNEREIKELFSVCIRSTLAGIEKPICSIEESRKRFEYKRNHPIEHNLKEVYIHKDLILSYLAFPLLDGVLKKYCSNYVQLDGKVINDFKVIRENGYQKKYEVGDLISSIEDLLLLVIQKVGEKELVNDLKSILQHISELENSNNPCKIIYTWRNSSLHGQTNYSTIGGTILNISIIIILHSIKDKYDTNLSQINEKVSWNVQTGTQPSWMFYPPYVQM